MKTYEQISILIAAEKGTIGPCLAESLMSGGFSSTVVDRRDSLFYELREGSYSVLILTNTSLIPEEIIQLIPEIKYFYKNIKIIVLSGYSDNEFPEKVIERGASDFFSLPVNLEKLTTCVKELLLEKEELEKTP